MVDIAVRLHAEYVAYSENGGDDPFLWDAATEISRLRSDLAACRKELAEAKGELYLAKNERDNLADSLHETETRHEARNSVLETALREEAKTYRIYARSLRSEYAGRYDIADELDIRATVLEQRAALEPPKC